MLVVRTTKDSLLMAENATGESLWTYNGDQVRRWSAEHAEHLHRWSEDQKYENRPHPPFRVRRDAAAAKYRDRMASTCHEATAQLAAYAERRKFAAV